MEKLKPIEDKLAELFKGTPQMSESARKSLAGVLEWLAIIFGVLQLLTVWSLWNTGHNANRLIDYANSLSAAYGGPDIAPKLGVVYYVALVFLLLSATTLLLAYPGLKARKKIGWDWLFVGVLINIVSGVVMLFVSSRYGGGVGDFLWSLIGSAIGFYLLFQVRSYFKDAKPKDSK